MSEQQTTHSKSAIRDYSTVLLKSCAQSRSSPGYRQLIHHILSSASLKPRTATLRCLGTNSREDRALHGLSSDAKAAMPTILQIREASRPEIDSSPISPPITYLILKDLELEKSPFQLRLGRGPRQDMAGLGTGLGWTGLAKKPSMDIFRLFISSHLIVLTRRARRGGSTAIKGISADQDRAGLVIQVHNNRRGAACWLVVCVCWIIQKGRERKD